MNLLRYTLLFLLLAFPRLARAAEPLAARDGFEFSGAHRGAWSEPARKKGQQGDAPLRESIRAGLVIAGPGVRKGSLGVVPMTSVAPTVARHLGIELSPLAGAPLDVQSTRNPE